MTNSINETQNAELFLVIGSNTTEAHPAIGGRMLRAVRRGAKLIVVDPRKIHLTEYADLHLQLKGGTNIAFLNGMINVIISEGLEDGEFIARRTEDYDSLKQVVAKYTPDYVERITGVPAQDLVKAARMYATTKKAMLFYCLGVTEFTFGVDAVKSCANLAMVTGHLGQECMGVNPIRGQNNVQGACDMGGLPNVFSGYQPVAEEVFREKFSKAWGRKISDKPGISLTEMIHNCGKNIKALYIMGENTVVAEPDINAVKKSLEKLDFLIVQDIFMTETARMADVVFPGASFAEKDGTFTNTERRVQRVRRAIPPVGRAKPDWQIICELASKMGYDMNFSSAEEIMEEISALTPSYGGINYKRLESVNGLQWPCPTEEHPGTGFQHKGTFTRGKGKFFAVDYRPPAELPDENYPFTLITGRNYFHYHTATMTGRVSILKREFPDNYVEINPADAQALGIKNGWNVEVSSRRGKLVCWAMVTDRVPPKTLYMTFHFPESACNVLTNSAYDPDAKCPELKYCAVRVRGV